MTANANKGQRNRLRRQFAELLKVEGKLALREPYGALGIGLPIILLIIFGYIGSQVPGKVGDTGLTILDLWIPTIMVISFVSIAISLPNTLVRDREMGWLRRVSTTPAHPSLLLAVQLILNLVIAMAAVLVILLGAAIVFGATLDVGIPLFVLATLLSIAEIFSLGLVIVALAPSDTVARTVASFLFFVLLFFSGLWVQPAQAGEPLRTIMYYSPTGAAARALLSSIFNSSPPYAALLTMAAYTVLFAFIAVRYFRWE